MAHIEQKIQEQKLLKAARARRQFKALVQHVIHNMFWIADYEDPNAVRVNTNLQRKGKKVFTTITDIAILRKRGEYRTKEEIIHLNKLIGKLKCFRPYPENVQLELVGVTYFEYYGPNRVLIKQNQEGHAMYFLLSGEVVVTKSVWDEITNTYNEEKVATLTPGKIFGEIALLQNVPRTATCTTTAPCELLVLKRDDFDRILKTNMMERWEEIKNAMKKFTYFDQWDSVTIRECCLLSEIESYSVNQVVYGDRKLNKKNPKMTYFLIEGRCSLIEHMYIKEKITRGIKSYTYFKAPNIKPPPTETKAFETIKNIEAECKNTNPKSREQSLVIKGTRKTVSEKKTLFSQNDQIIPPDDSDETVNIFSERATDFKNLIRGSTRELYLEREEIENRSNNTENEDGEEEQILEYERTMEREQSANMYCQSKNDRKTIEFKNLIKGSTRELYLEKEEIENTSNNTENEDGEEEKILKYKRTLETEMSAQWQNRNDSNLSFNIPDDYELIFIQICTLEEKASFAEGDLMNNRRILALTPVKVLLIPSYWLEQRNRANMWNRIDKYLHHRIPTTEEVFKAYVDNKNWSDYKKKIRDKIFSKSKFPNTTTIHDVPYSVRALNPH